MDEPQKHDTKWKMLGAIEEVTLDLYMNCLWKANIQTISLSMVVSDWNREWGLLENHSS